MIRRMTNHLRRKLAALLLGGSMLLSPFGGCAQLMEQGQDRDFQIWGGNRGDPRDPCYTGTLPVVLPGCE